MFKGAEQKPRNLQEHPQVAYYGTLQYPHRLNFYDKPPLFDVTVEEFETCALDRLRILAEIESSAARNRSWEETKSVTHTQCLKYLPLSNNSATKMDLNAQRRKDHLGHFVLRLAFSRSEELRRRFVKAESTLFRIRYENDDSMERQQFLDSRDFNWILVDKDEMSEYRKELSSVSENEKFFKVKWTRVPDLVEKRRVFLKGGWAYVPAREQASVVYQDFEVQLMGALEMTNRALPRLDEDNRLLPILDNLCKGFLSGVPSDWVASAPGKEGEITADMVDDIAKQHYPLCMKNLHQNLRKDHHLKHFERLTYGLFLKVLGLSIDEAITFWRKSFTGGPAETKFDKEHKYNIRHSYGLEGRRANYPAKSCQQLLVSDSASYGCPYRYFTPDNLQTALLSAYSSQGLKSSDIPEVMQTVRSKHFHVACTRVFEITHSQYNVKKGEGVGSGESVTHPNQYTAKSMEMEKAVKENLKGEMGMEID
ncbi:DNA primase large subunit [Dendrothele bispora CBS 962.96]|uniref:DNA primase large subunit n=1 Tax=Dendrothele bispora (strain CBS 962.96) TaxID=1314807 RepID=A0A4S8MAL4_DENBC|nr:DNA primase large subunit [Dendrothele bispora CBS 962.96]